MDRLPSGAPVLKRVHEAEAYVRSCLRAKLRATLWRCAATLTICSFGIAVATRARAQTATATQRELAVVATINRILVETPFDPKARGGLLRRPPARNGIDVEELTVDGSPVRLLRTGRRASHVQNYLLALVGDVVLSLGGFQQPTVDQLQRLGDPDLLRCDQRAIDLIELLFDPFGLNLLELGSPSRWRSIVDSSTRVWRAGAGSNTVRDDSVSLGESGFIKRHTYLSPRSAFSMQWIPVYTVFKCDKDGTLRDIMRIVGRSDAG